MQNRSFGSTTQEVEERAGAFVKGLRNTNKDLVTLGKHYPGYNVAGNSDNIPVKDPSSEQATFTRASPFTKVEGLDGVMLGSVIYPNVREEGAGAQQEGGPACFSKRLVDEYRKTNPNGLVITDDLDAGALHSQAVRDYRANKTLKDPALDQLAKDEVRQNAKKAFLAGADVLMVMDQRKKDLVAEGIQLAIDDEKDPAKQQKLRDQLDRSSRRVATLARRAQ
jgi:beta-glucosidase-like glycosyl hydrolase